MRQLLEVVLVLIVSPLALVENAAEKEPAPKPVAIEDSQATISPENTTIEFTGLHAGAQPNPRVGYFTKFQGELTFDENNNPTGGTVEIDTTSLVTPIQKLTQHLKSPDFFDVRQYPKATFKATNIEDAPNASDVNRKITGELTIRGKTNEITFPAAIRVSDNGIVLESRFDIQRSKFGMTFGPDRVVDEVSMHIVVGKKTPTIKSE